MKTISVLTLIIAAPSPLQDGLLALMTTSRQINAVFVVEEASLALRMVKDHHPKLVILDGRLPQAQMLLQQIKNEWPQTGCLVLLGGAGQEQAFKQADAVLIEGFSPSRLLATIENLLGSSNTFLDGKSVKSRG